MALQSHETGQCSVGVSAGPPLATTLRASGLQPGALRFVFGLRNASGRWRHLSLKARPPSNGCTSASGIFLSDGGMLPALPSDMLMLPMGMAAGAGSRRFFSERAHRFVLKPKLPRQPLFSQLQNRGSIHSLAQGDSRGPSS